MKLGRMVCCGVVGVVSSSKAGVKDAVFMNIFIRTLGNRCENNKLGLSCAKLS